MNVQPFRNADFETAEPLALFRGPTPAPDKRKRMIAIGATALVHLALLAGFLLKPGLIALPAPDNTLNVSVLTETLAEPPPPPPRPQLLERPRVTTQIPQIVIMQDEPTNAITITRPVSPPPPAPSKATDNYFARVMAHLSRLKRYPDIARSRREEGTVYLRFMADRDGQVLSFSIERSSGIQALDAEVRALIARAQPLPPIPDELQREQVEMVLPVEFSLARR
jgi:protein TonB